MKAVLRGTADAAFAPAGVLEQWVARSRMSPGAMKFVGQLDVSYQAPGYPYGVSCRDMYGSASLIQMPTPGGIATSAAVAKALLDIAPSDSQAMDGDYSQWLPALPSTRTFDVMARRQPLNPKA